MKSTLIARTVSVATIAALALTACSNDKTPETTTAETTTTASSSSAATKAADKTDASNLHLEDAFVKAAPEGQKMTAVFGTIVNDTDKVVHLTSFTADVKAKTFQLHEVVDGQMKEKEGGFVIPANSEYELKPGGDHLMIMGLQQAIEPGSKVTVTLNLEDGSQVKIPDVPVRAIGAGNENYGDSSMDHSMMMTTPEQPAK